MLTYLLTGQTREECRRQMNYHISLDFRRGARYTFSSLILFSLLAITFSISNSFAQEAETITLTTNKNFYQPGELVQLKGTTSGQLGLLVAIQIKDSSGNLIISRVVQTDQNGNFALQFKIPPNATSGNFNIIATARINGFVVTQTKTMDATVPEFGKIAMPVFAISIMSVMIMVAQSGKFKIFHIPNL